MRARLAALTEVVDGLHVSVMCRLLYAYSSFRAYGTYGNSAFLRTFGRIMVGY
jgi:hypothetical protein